MTLFPRQRAVMLTLVYCCAAALICGAWTSGGFGLSGRIAENEEAAYLDSGESSFEIRRALGARKLTSTEEMEADSEKEDHSEASNMILSLEIAKDDELELQGTLPQLYHSPQVFAMNYKDMANNLRIYLYPAQNESDTRYEYTNNGERSELGEEPSDTMTDFFNLLAKSDDFVTDDPDLAHLFFLPVSIDALWTGLGPAKVGEYLRHYVQSVRDKYTFWDRSLGADHFYLSSHAYDPINHRNNLELTKNAVQVACSPLRGRQTFYPHKDIVLPSYKPPTMAQDLTSASYGHRSTLAFVSNPLDGVDAISASMLQTWISDSDFDFEFDTESSNAKLSSSKFCVSVSPHVMLNVVDALRSGCVPVLISDSIIYDLPFQDVLNWHEFSVVIGTKAIPNLKTLLSSIPPEKYHKMQYLGHQASKHMEWNDPPAAYDAFHMTLFELWMRRHSIKYSRRSDSSSVQSSR